LISAMKSTSVSATFIVVRCLGVKRISVSMFHQVRTLVPLGTKILEFCASLYCNLQVQATG